MVHVVNQRSFNQSLADQLTGRLAAVRMSQGQLSDLTGTSKGTIQRYLAGTRQIPIPFVDTFAQATGTTVSELVAAAENALGRAKPANT